MVKKHLKKNFWKYFFIILSIFVLGCISYNYYYYQKSKTLALDVYKSLDIILKDLNSSFSNFNKDTNHQLLLSDLNKATQGSQNLARNNSTIMNNFFVKLSRVNGILFPSEVGDILLWHSNFNDKLISLNDNLNYFLNQGIVLSLFNKNSNTKEALNKSKTALYEINRLLTENEEFEGNFKDIEELKQNIRNFNNFIDSFDFVLGNQKNTKHLIIFQNPYNLSATGGEWVAYGILNCKDSICQLENTDLVSNLNIAMIDKLIPPEELKFANTVWVFQNFNWFYNFKTSAEIALKYYPENIKFNGLIAINSNDISELKTKKDLDLFVSAFNTKLNTSQFSNWLFNGLNTKDIQVYSNNSSIETFLNDFDWSGNFPNLEANTDYLGLARANTGREDTDKDIEETIQLKVNINEQGEITNSLDFILSNNNSSRLRTKNFSYLRTYIPSDSEIISIKTASTRGYAPKPSIDYFKQGFVYEPNVESLNIKTVYMEKQDAKAFIENDLNGIGSWIITSGGNKKTTNLVYILPFKIDLKNKRQYKIFLEKQSGTNRTYNIEVSYPDPKDPTKTNSITRSLDLKTNTLLSFDLN